MCQDCRREEKDKTKNGQPRYAMGVAAFIPLSFNILNTPSADVNEIFTYPLCT
jgi:hypothetical protein